MKTIFRLIIFVLSGALISTALGLDNIENAQWYIVLTGALLAIGLYSSTYGIELTEARQHLRIILSAVTVGVFLKALIIGGSLAVITGDPFYLILGVIVAQIDPLSVSTLMHGKRLSKRAKTILASWASFDDPITVIMALYAPVIVAQLVGTDWVSITGTANANAGLINYFAELGINIAYAAGVFIVWLLIKTFLRKSYALLATILSVGVYALLATALSIAAYYFWMLGIALMGLYLRPPINALIDHATKWALVLATILLGVLLIDGINIWTGIMLGVVAYLSQIIVGFLLTYGLSRRDRVHIAFAQQNGITAIILSLLFEPAYPGTVAIVAPAILTINILHEGVNRLVDKHILHETPHSS